MPLSFLGDPDFILLHPPTVYDFREALTVPGPIADLVPSGPFFEMFPIGFSFLGEYLQRHGFRTRVVNLASRMVEKPSFDARRFIRKVRPGAFGIGFHWLPHCQGALEVARICKEEHPDTPVVMGGYSASLFHRELMEHPQVDYVVRGDSTEEPLMDLVRALRAGTDTSGIPNLTRRGPGGVVSNPLSYVPEDLGHLGDNYLFMLRSAVRHVDLWGFRAFRGWWSYPMTAVLTCRGCSYNCSFCGGSRSAMKRCFNRASPAFREPERIAADVRTIAAITGAPIFLVGDLRQNGDDYASEVLARIAEEKPRNHIVIEFFEPAPRSFFEEVAASIDNFDFEISPESHDPAVRMSAGKGYSNRDMEDNIRWGLDAGCGRFDVFFMIGLSGQDRGSVMDTVSYCRELMSGGGGRVNALMGPMAPFLDPGSVYHDNAEKYGYRLFFHTLEDYRKAMMNASWRDMLSYETRWLSRQQIVDVTYDALTELSRAKEEAGLVSGGYAAEVRGLLRESRSLLDLVDRAGEGAEGNRELMSRVAALRSGQSLVKEEITWPVEGRKFYYPRIARMALSRHRNHRLPGSSYT